MIKHARCIVIDFDHTVFDTTRYVIALKKALVHVGVTTQEFDAKRSYLKRCCSLVDIDTFIQHLSFADKSLLHDTIHHVIVQVASSLIFPDVQPFIDRHYNRFDLILLTQGNQELQREKIAHSALQHITATVITSGKKDETIAPLMQQYDDVHFIDDKTKHISEVKKAFANVTTYWIVRPEDHPYGNQGESCTFADVIITDLTLTIP